MIDDLLFCPSPRCTRFRFHFGAHRTPLVEVDVDSRHQASLAAASRALLEECDRSDESSRKWWEYRARSAAEQEAIRSAFASVAVARRRGEDPDPDQIALARLYPV